MKMHETVISGKVSHVSLPNEIIHLIIDHLEPTLPMSLVCKYWYSINIKRRVRLIHLSTRMILGLSRLSETFLAAMRNHTTHLQITLQHTYAQGFNDLHFKFSPASPKASTSNDELNGALWQLASSLPTFRCLESFSLHNYMEVRDSCQGISGGTFEHIVANLTVRALDSVSIDMPGAPLENRLQLLFQPGIEKPHYCDAIRRNFPNTRVFQLRMRELCPDVFRAQKLLPRLEKLEIRLEFEPEDWQELDLDASVHDCRHMERFGRDLFNSLEERATEFYLGSLTPKLHTFEITCLDNHPGKIRRDRKELYGLYGEETTFSRGGMPVR